MKKTLFTALVLLLGLVIECLPCYSANHQYPAGYKKDVSIMTYVSSNEQERAVKALIKSVSDLSGEFQNTTSVSDWRVLWKGSVDNGIHNAREN